MFKHVTMWSKSVFFIVFLSLSGLALSVDTDGDGYSDDDELDWGSDPLDANSAPMGGLSLTLIKAFLDKKKGSLEQNSQPVIGNVSFIVPENEVIVGSINATDIDEDSLTYSISGIDASFFYISESGTLTFREPADYEIKRAYNLNAIVSDGLESTSQNVQIQVENYAFALEAKQKLLSFGYNQPTLNPVNQIYVAGLDVPESMGLFYNEVQSLLNRSLGGYPNYAHVIWNEFGSDSDAKPVTDKIGELRGLAVDLSDLSQNCLASENAASGRSSVTNPVSVCFETRDWTANPFGGNEGDFINSVKLAQHYAHEYFHHYQRVHALERGLDYQSDRNEPSTTVKAPTWWVEPAAITFQNAWFKQYYSQLDLFASSEWDDVNLRIGDASSSQLFKQARRAIMGVSGDLGMLSSCPEDWELTFLEERYDTETGCAAWRLAVPFLAYKTSYKVVWLDIPRSYYDLGFDGAFEKYYGKSKEEFYADFNEFMRTGDAEDEPPQGWAPDSADFNRSKFLEISPEGL